MTSSVLNAANFAFAILFVIAQMLYSNHICIICCQELKDVALGESQPLYGKYLIYAVSQQWHRTTNWSLVLYHRIHLNGSHYLNRTFRKLRKMFYVKNNTTKVI
jgi:hypothetical protein